MFEFALVPPRTRALEELVAYFVAFVVGVVVAILRVVTTIAAASLVASCAVFSELAFTTQEILADLLREPPLVG